MGQLSGKTAIVTGAASGMGREEAILFALEGAEVVATDVNEAGVKAVVDEIVKQGGKAIALAHDVSSEEQWQQVVDTCLKTYGKIDVLVNNAGVSSEVTVLDATVDQWNKVMAINVTSVFLGMKYVIPHMKAAGGGSIVNISSIAGLSGCCGAGPYTASKGAVRMLTKAAAVDYGKDNIRVNSIHPGYIDTPMSSKYIQHEQTFQYFMSLTPMLRVGQPSEVAKAALFLASDASSYVTGVELAVDGGVTAK